VISDAAGTAARYDYIGPWRVERREHGNGTRMEVGYDGVKRIVSTTHKTGAGAALDERSYGWDAMYNKTSCVDLLPGGRNQQFAYDSAYRMIQSTGGLFGMVDYALDGVGNRQTVTGLGADAGTYTMNPSTPEPADFHSICYSRKGRQIATLRAGVRGPGKIPLRV
jgi:hypothetical protein